MQKFVSTYFVGHTHAKESGGLLVFCGFKKHVKYALFKLLRNLKNREKDEATCGLTCKTHF